MKNLNYLIQRLTNKELNSLKRYYNTTNKIRMSKKNELLQLILKKNNLTDEICSLKIYKKKATFSFHAFKKRASFRHP